MKDYISVHNVPVSLEERICFNKTKCMLYINDYSWVVDIEGYYEFYYTPNHFIGKISSSQMPHIVIERLKKYYKSINGEEIRYGRTKAQLRPSPVRLQSFEHKMQIGTWYHAQGQNYFTFDNKFVCDDMYVANCESECSFSEIDGPLIHDMLRMGCQTRTPNYYRGVFDFPCFHGINTKDIILLPFDGMEWDAKRWASEFKSLTESMRIHKSRGTSDDIRNMRTEVFMHTVNVIKQGEYQADAGKTVELPNDSDVICNTVFYDHEIPVVKKEDCGEQTIVEVKNIDCLYAGVELKDQGYNPAVLNMASRRNPGGGVATGAGAQEETLFRRTNLFRSLYQFAPYAEQYGIKPSHHHYPLDRNFGGVYTPDAIYFRESEQKGYALLEKPVNLSFITVAGMNRPDLTDDGFIAPYHVEPIKNKIRTIFRIGLVHGHDSLVLGALGCGAFRNPPRHVARLFHEVMDEPEFKDKYRLIVFAILDDHNAHQKHNPEGNFKPFAEEFAGMDNQS